MKFIAVKRNGKYIGAGFTSKESVGYAPGDETEEYDDVQGAIINAIVDGRPKPKTWQEEVAVLKAQLVAKGVL